MVLDLVYVLGILQSLPFHSSSGKTPDIMNQLGSEYTKRQNLSFEFWVICMSLLGKGTTEQFSHVNSIPTALISVFS